MIKMLKLIRVPYGKETTPKELREYKIDGRGPVGTLTEFKKRYPTVEFQVLG